MKVSNPTSRNHCALLQFPVLCSCILALACAPGTLRAQEETAGAPPTRQGLQVRTVSAYEVYYSNSLPSTGGFLPGGANLPSDVGVGGSTEINWSKFSERSTFSLTYTPSYTARVRYSSLDALNHALLFNTSTRFAPRWDFSFSVSGNYMSQEQALFNSGSLSNVASVPSTFNDLASAVLTNNYAGNPQLGVALTNSPLVESPVRTLLYGSRMFTSSATASLSYSFSPRLSMSFTGGGSRSQHVSDDQTIATGNSYLLLDTTSANAGVSLNYSLSPRTQIGASANTSRTVSQQQDAYITTSQFTFGRTLSRRWLTQLHGGIGFTNPVRQLTSYKISTTPHPAAGGSLGFKTLSSTILGSFDHTVSDSYGLGASTSNNANAAYRWHRHGTPWSLQGSFGWQRMEGNGIQNTSGWQASAGWDRMLRTGLILSVQYAYLNYSGGFASSGATQSSLYKTSQSALRVSIVWTPQSGIFQ
jgi:hypothetical protein